MVAVFTPGSARPDSAALLATTEVEASPSERPATPPRSCAPAALRRRIAEILALLPPLPITDLETSPERLNPLEALVGCVACDARALLGDVHAYYAHPAHDGRPRSGPIADFVAVAATDFDAMLRLLEAGHGVLWQRIATCDIALDSTRRALRALDALIADAEGLPHGPDDTRAETATALRLRAAFVRLHRATTGDGPPDARTVRARLRAVGCCIAATLAGAIARSIRAHDRHVMRLLLARIRAALGDARPAEARADGDARLWFDLASFTELLLEVNKRDHLRTHDRVSAACALAELQNMPRDARCPDEVLATLRQCEGRDPELDALVADGAAAGPLCDCLERVIATLTASARTLRRDSGTWSDLG